MSTDHRPHGDDPLAAQEIAEERAAQDQFF
jgi:hypothetical protein